MRDGGNRVWSSFRSEPLRQGVRSVTRLAEINYVIGFLKVKCRSTQTPYKTTTRGKESYLRRISSKIFRSSGNCEAVDKSRQISTMNAIAREWLLLFSGDSNTIRGDRSCSELHPGFVIPSPSQDWGALSWAVSRLLSPNLRVRFDRKPVRMGFVVDQVTMEQVFYRALQPFFVSVWFS
jgi:hypothetical protein